MNSPANLQLLPHDEYMCIFRFSVHYKHTDKTVFFFSCFFSFYVALLCASRLSAGCLGNELHQNCLMECTLNHTSFEANPIHAHHSHCW